MIKAKLVKVMHLGKGDDQTRTVNTIYKSRVHLPYAVPWENDIAAWSGV
jgi:hypothetical protein